MNRYAALWMYCLLLSAMLYSIQSCTSAVSASAKSPGHSVEVHQNGSVLYVDRSDNHRVLKDGGNGLFTSFKVGFADSLPIDAKLINDRNVYFNYRMSNDWRAVVNGDSLIPVFYQPLTSLNTSVNEGVLVFELRPNEKQPDTLVYSDSYGNWQQQVIVLNKFKKGS